jgi:hypothetical protein
MQTYVDLEGIFDWLREQQGDDKTRLGALIGGNYPEGKVEFLRRYCGSRGLTLSIIEGGFPLIVSKTNNGGKPGVLLANRLEGFTPKEALDILESLPSDWIFVATTSSSDKLAGGLRSRLLPLIP